MKIAAPILPGSPRSLQSILNGETILEVALRGTSSIRKHRLKDVRPIAGQRRLCEEMCERLKQAVLKGVSGPERSLAKRTPSNSRFFKRLQPAEIKHNPLASQAGAGAENHRFSSGIIVLDRLIVRFW